MRDRERGTFPEKDRKKWEAIDILFPKHKIASMCTPVRLCAHLTVAATEAQTVGETLDVKDAKLFTIIS